MVIHLRMDDARPWRRVVSDAACGARRHGRTVLTTDRSLVSCKRCIRTWTVYPSPREDFGRVLTRIACEASLFERCIYCGSWDDGRMEGDHVIPRSWGGTLIAPACGPCNRRKAAQSPGGWLGGLIPPRQWAAVGGLPRVLMVFWGWHYPISELLPAEPQIHDQRELLMLSGLRGERELMAKRRERR